MPQHLYLSSVIWRSRLVKSAPWSFQVIGEKIPLKQPRFFFSDDYHHCLPLFLFLKLNTPTHLRIESRATWTHRPSGDQPRARHGPSRWAFLSITPKDILQTRTVWSSPPVAKIFPSVGCTANPHSWPRKWPSCAHTIHHLSSLHLDSQKAIWPFTVKR